MKESRQSDSSPTAVPQQAAVRCGNGGCERAPLPPATATPIKQVYCNNDTLASHISGLWASVEESAMTDENPALSPNSGPPGPASSFPFAGRARVITTCNT